MDNTDEEDLWNLVGFILASKNRINILQYLNNNSALPSQISKKFNIPMGHTSNLLKGLQNKNLVKCLNPDLKKGRIYTITKLGSEINQNISKISKNNKKL